MSNTKLRIGFGTFTAVITAARRTLYQAHYYPTHILCSQYRDFVSAGWLARSSESIKIGNVAAFTQLIQSSSRLLLLSCCCDPQLSELVEIIHKNCCELPSLYNLKTMVLFNQGFPVYDFTVHEIPYGVVLPWEDEGK